MSNFSHFCATSVNVHPSWRSASSGMLRPCKNRCFYTKWLCTSSQRASVSSYGHVPSSPILVTLMMEALSSSETSVLTRATRHNIPENAILHSHCHENKSFTLLFIANHNRFQHNWQPLGVQIIVLKEYAVVLFFCSCLRLLLCC
jgi:hypothetical protein